MLAALRALMLHRNGAVITKLKASNSVATVHWIKNEVPEIRVPQSDCTLTLAPGWCGYDDGYFRRIKSQGTGWDAQKQ